MSPIGNELSVRNCTSKDQFCMKGCPLKNMSTSNKHNDCCILLLFKHMFLIPFACRGTPWKKLTKNIKKLRQAETKLELFSSKSADRDTSRKKKTVHFWMASKPFWDANSMSNRCHKVTQRGLFPSMLDAQSENSVLAWAPASFAGFQGILKPYLTLWMVFWDCKTYSLRRQFGMAFSDFKDFWWFRGFPWDPIWYSVPQTCDPKSNQQSLAFRVFDGRGWNSEG